MKRKKESHEALSARNGDTGERPIHPTMTETMTEMAGLLRRANAARDVGDFRTAASLFAEYVGQRPDHAAIHIQCGHMFKEIGDLSAAEHYYIQAKNLSPDDPDLALQLGHFYKIAGRLAEAELSYHRACDLDRNSPEPAFYLGDLYRLGWRNHVEQVKGQHDGVSGHSAQAGTAPLQRDRQLLPELAPRPRGSLLHSHSEEVQVRALGRVEHTRWGDRNTLRGVDAIRGFCVSAVPITELRASLNGLHYCITPLDAFELIGESEDRKKRKYVFNIWYDFSNFREGPYDLELQFCDKGKQTRVYQAQIVIARALCEDDYPYSDRLVSFSAPDTRSLEEYINSRPSMIRPAQRTYFVTPPQNVLILSVDELSDVVVSIPALRRLRELLPTARLVGLVSLANADLARSLDLLDEIIAVDFPNDAGVRRRVMPLEKQDELRRRLGPYKFDIAIDLSDSESSRPLLRLSGAPHLVGFTEGRSDWLSLSFETHASDPLTVPRSTRVSGLVEGLGALLTDRSQIVRRSDLKRERLVSPPFDLAANTKFAVLHSGARLRINRWPHFNALAAMILDQTNLNVVMMSDEPRDRSTLPGSLPTSERFRFLDRRLAFDDFDALLSYCTVFVGNNTGPAHLASLRGANVIMIYLARNNWSEFSHENRGYIISRRVPCAGCGIDRYPEECGKGISCITNITPDEVFHTVLKFV